MKQTESQRVQERTTWYDRLLDGERSWGSIDIYPPRYGFHKYRLVLYPPGILRADRRLVRAWRGWPVWGTAQWLLTVVCLNAFLTPGAAALWALSAWGAVGAALFVMSNAVRGAVRAWSVVLIDGYSDGGATAKYESWKGLSQQLIDADTRLADGRMSILDHEALWSRAYDRMEEAVSHG